MSLNPDALRELVTRYGTPLYVYDLMELRAARRDLADALPREATLFYSLKANPHPDVVRELIGQGCAAEVSSQGELDVALAAGAAASQCLYTGPGKTESEVDHALAVGVRLFSVDSAADLARLGWCARRRGVSATAVLRLNPDTYPRDAGLAMGGTATQFGVDIALVRDVPEDFRAEGVELVGYHVFIGTNATDVSTVAGWVELALNTVREAQNALRLRLRLVDLGGGFGHPYAAPGPRPDLRALRPAVDRLIDRHLPGGTDRPRVAFESGRYLTAAAGSLVLRVQDVKASNGTRFVIADAGVNVLGGMYGLRRVPPIAAAALRLASRDEPAGGAELGVLVGPLCTPLDTLNPRLDVSGVRQGNLLAVPNVGGYGLTASLAAFLSRPPPVEVCVHGGVVRSATRLHLSYRPAGPQPPRHITPHDNQGEHMSAHRDRFIAMLRPHLPMVDPHEEVPWDQRLRSLGLNSMRAVDLVMDLEEEFGLVFPDRLFHDDTFATAEALWGAIGPLLAGPSSSLASTP